MRAPDFAVAARVDLDRKLSDVGGFVANGKLAVVLEDPSTFRDHAQYEVALLDVGTREREPLWSYVGPHKTNWLVVSPAGDKFVFWSPQEGLHMFLRTASGWQRAKLATDFNAVHQKPVWLDDDRYAVAGESYGPMPPDARAAAGSSGQENWYHVQIYVGEARGGKPAASLDAFSLTYSARSRTGIVWFPAGSEHSSPETRAVSYDGAWRTGERIGDVTALGSSFLSDAGLLVLETLPTEGEPQQLVRGLGGPGAKWNVQVLDPRTGAHATILRSVWFPKLAYQDVAPAPREGK